MFTYALINREYIKYSKKWKSENFSENKQFPRFYRNSIPSNHLIYAKSTDERTRELDNICLYWE